MDTMNMLHIRQTLDMLASGLSQLSNNAALPEMVRNEFRQIADNAMANIGMITASHEGTILSGHGIQSTALRNACKYLGQTVEGNLDNLAVKVLPAIDEEHLAYAMCRWSQMLMKLWPTIDFDTDGKMIKVIHSGSLIIDIELTPKSSSSEGMSYIDKVSYRLYTPECWWDLTGSIERSHALYNSNFQYHSAHLCHHVEDAFASLTNKHLAQSVLDVLAEELMVDETVDTVLSSAHNQARRSFSPSALLEIAAGKVHSDRVIAALNKGMYHFNDRSRSGYGRQIKFDGGYVSISTNDTDWNSWERMNELKMKNSWARDKTPLTFENIELHGVNVSERQLPTSILNTIKDAVEVYMNGLFPDAEWYTPIPVKEENE